MPPLKAWHALIMEYLEGNIYHIYNRGNDRKRIFYEERNYSFFMEKVTKFITPACDILSFALMPNHFHFLIHANEFTQEPIKRGMLLTNPLSEGLRLTLSSFAQAINVQESKTGSRFQQNTKSKCVTLKHSDYSNLCFNYIHQNAYKAGLVEKMEDWKHSSFADYLSSATGSFCNKALAVQLLDLNMDRFYEDSYEAIDEEQLRNIF